MLWYHLEIDDMITYITLLNVQVYVSLLKC